MQREIKFMYKGKYPKDMTREELIEAVNNLGIAYTKEIDKSTDEVIKKLSTNK